MSTITTYAPFIILFGAFLLLIIVLYGFRTYYHVRKKRSPLTQDLLGAPGQSLYKRADFLNGQIQLFSSYLLMTPIFLYATYISQLYFSKSDRDALLFYFLVATCIVLTLYFFIKLIYLLREQRIVRLGYQSKLIVGQALNQLMLRGYHVYHDFSASRFNIDHIVVGKPGVFVIETKAQSGSTSRNFTDNSIVTYDGRVLHFPGSTDSKTLNRAQRKAAWLTKRIQNMTGEQLVVRPVVALPGWYVKRTSAEGMPVVNPDQFSSLFEHITPWQLSENMMAKITYQFDKKFRDVDTESQMFDVEPLQTELFKE